MKKFVFLIMVLFSLFLLGQNVTENRIVFDYQQLPEKPIDSEYNTYRIIVDHNYEQANQDSMMLYLTMLDSITHLYDLEILAWKKACKNIKRNYLTQMSKWQKTINEGETIIVEPTAPVYPIQPIQPLLDDPLLHSKISNNTLSGFVGLDGFDYSESKDGAVVIVGINPISDIKIINEKKTTGSNIKYIYKLRYKLPISLTVQSPNQGIVLQKTLGNKMQYYPLETYLTEYDFDLWWLDNKDTFWSNFQNVVRNKVLKEADYFMNEQCGFPIKQRTCEVYTVKKHKGHKYDDLLHAYRTVSEGYSAVVKSKDYIESKNKLNEAIRIWEQALSESNPLDKKARVNEKITTLLYCNLAEAYCWINDFDKSLEYIHLAKRSNVGRFKKIADEIEQSIVENQQKFNLNN